MQQTHQLFILKICAVVYSQFRATHRSKPLLPGISLYSNGKAAPLQPFAVFHAQYFLTTVTVFIIPIVEVPTKLCVRQRDALH